MIPRSWSINPSSEISKLTMVIFAVVSGGKCGFFNLKMSKMQAVFSNFTKLKHDKLSPDWYILYTDLVVMYIRKSLEYSIVDSPNLMQTDPPCWKVCFWSNGSKAGWRNSPTFSSSTGVPNWIQFSKLLKKSLSDCFKTVRFFCFSIVLIHRFAMSYNKK